MLQLETAADSAACGTFLIPNETMLLEFNNYQDIYTVSNVISDSSCTFQSFDLSVLIIQVTGTLTHHQNSSSETECGGGGY